MIEINQLTKNYGPIKAVDDISFKVEKGEVLGFLGPNGAGKSTTMKVITGFIEPSHGEVKVCEIDISNSPKLVQSKIGYVPENAPLYEDMMVKEFLEFISEMRGIKKEEVNSRIEEIIELCALSSVKNRPIETLSKGYKRRVSLAQALLHDPEVLILDEPTDGLDPNQKHDVRNLIKKLSKDKCIILSTHILEEVQSVCSRAIIIAKGKKLFDGTPEELKSKSENGKLDDVFRAMTTGQNVEGVRL